MSLKGKTIFMFGGNALPLQSEIPNKDNVQAADVFVPDELLKQTISNVMQQPEYV